MATPNVTNSLNLINSLYSSNIGKVTNMLNNVSDTSNIAGISNVDSYVKSSLLSSQVKTTYSPPAQPNPFNVSNMESALNAIGAATDFSAITNINEYAGEVFSESQLSEEGELTGIESEVGKIDGLTNLDSSINSAFEENKTVLNPEAVNINGMTDMSNVLTSVYNAYKTSTDKLTGSIIDSQA